MAQILTKYAAKKMLSKKMNENKHKDVAGQYDPYYAKIPHPTKPGKFKKVKRQIPDYIPEHDAVILAKMRQRAYALDMSLFNFMGVRFGWSSVIGLIPAAGDAIDGALAFLLFLRCSKVECGLGSTTTMLMLINIVVDFLVGLVPIIGDLADAAIRANSKNVRLLEKRLDEVYKPKHLVDADKRKNHPVDPATVYEDFSSDDEDRLPRHRQDLGDSYHSHQDNGVARPQPARVPHETRGGERPDRHGSKRVQKSSGSRRERDRRGDRVEMSESNGHRNGRH